MTTRLFLVEATGDLTLESITLAGGLAQGAAGEVGRGGAVLVSAGGRLELVASTLVDNVARGGSGMTGRGGAIYADSSSLVVTNSTLSDNGVENSIGEPAGFGGSIYSLNGTMEIYSSTVVDGLGTTGYGAYLLADGATATAVIRNTVISQVDSPTIGFDLVLTYDHEGIVQVAGGNNLIGTLNDFKEISLVIGNDPPPLLGPLANNGGPTLTRVPLEGSPVIDAGDPTAAAGMDGVPLADQRGLPFSRVADGGAGGDVIDIGAVEVQAEPAGPSLPGDYNGDHTVNAADYTVWRNSLGAEVAKYAGADGDGSGQVDAGDYMTWRSYYGNSEPQGATQAVTIRAANAAVAVVEEGSGEDVAGVKAPAGGAAAASGFRGLSALVAWQEAMIRPATAGRDLADLSSSSRGAADVDSARELTLLRSLLDERCGMAAGNKAAGDVAHAAPDGDVSHTVDGWHELWSTWPLRRLATLPS